MKWKIFKFSAKLICFFFGFFSIERFCHRQTEGFTLAKISYQIKKDNEDLAFNSNLLKQRFFYYAKGAECYVFLGEDGQTILKFFRLPRSQLQHVIHTIFPYFPEKKENSLKKTLINYQWAARYFSQESALLGTHLGKTNLPIDSLKIVDKLKISHTIETKNVPFILQKKAVLIKEKITEFMDLKQHESALLAIKSILSLLEKQKALGMYDVDANLSKNFGFIGNEAVQIDLGCLEPLSGQKNEKLLASKEHLQHWLNATYPEFAVNFNELFQEYIQSNKL